MNNTRLLIFLLTAFSAFSLGACNDKRHDLSREYKLEHYAFVLVSTINDREFYLKIMRETLQEKRKTILDPGRGDTLTGDQQYLATRDTMFYRSDDLLYEPVKRMDSAKPYDTKPPENFTRGEAAGLNKQVADLVTVFRQINGAYKRFDSYYKKAGYREDKGNAGLALIDSIRILDAKFGAISDSLILRSDGIFKEIYNVPEAKYPFGGAAAEMERAIKSCNSYIKQLEQFLPGSKPYNAAAGKALRPIRDSIGQHINQLVHLGLFGTERSVWADMMLLKFRDEIFSLRNYYEIRLPEANGKGRIQMVDLDFLKARENAMRRCYHIFRKL